MYCFRFSWIRFRKVLHSCPWAQKFWHESRLEANILVYSDLLQKHASRKVSIRRIGIALVDINKKLIITTREITKLSSLRCAARHQLLLTPSVRLETYRFPPTRLPEMHRLRFYPLFVLPLPHHPLRDILEYIRNTLPCLRRCKE